MGDVAVRMKVMPESTDVDLVKLGEEIKEAVPSLCQAACHGGECL